VAAAVLALMLGGTLAACGDDDDDATGTDGEKRTSITMATLGFPSRATPIGGVMEAKGLAEKNGLDLKIKQYADGAAYYAALASGEVDTLMGGVGVFQSMINQGVPIKILATAAGINAQVFSRNPDVKELTDLKGKTLAATTAFSEFQNLAIEAESQGLNLLKDVKVVDTQPSDILLQLKAKRADAGLLWDPNAQVLLDELPDLEVIADSSELWKELTGLDGWELVVAVRTKWLDSAGEEGARNLIASMVDAQNFIADQPSEAGAVFEKITSYPVKFFEKVVEAGTFKYNIEPVWEGAHVDEVFAQFEASAKAGYADKVPGKDALYSPGG
jgi:ABC-type nitrate/sulfonate/bicarbonate transport system substrate-binding protein